MKILCYVNKQGIKGQRVFDSTYTRHPEQSSSETGSGRVVTRGCRQGGQLLFNGYRVSGWDKEKGLEMDGADEHKKM